ncbi:P22 coat protein-gene protein 5 [Sporobacter termitidis DSM 10068]|uniref:p22 coat protein-gene protein 5 n=1 Tax=Sporobacter termitidis DSM 10068 TaxID=1123282 RepID=A0A1M5ZJA6_9FIRM|nr:P22 phage major capsid protein family protein [Sporobacter termitidis]SHI24316.1 P22 coat protein-gene protein 5 [Sporobacter termitidis DSM 10068]
MPNQWLDVKEIARPALVRLIENLVFPNLIYKDYSSQFVTGKGAKIQVKKPVVLNASEFDANTGTSAQAIDDSQSVEVTLDTIATVDVEVGALEGAVSFDDVNRIFIEPAAVALAQKINSDGLELYRDIPYIGGDAGTTPDDLTDFAAAGLVLDQNKVPVVPRNALWDPVANSKFKTIPAVVNAEKSGTTDALRRGSIGTIFNLDNYMSQAVKKHTAGTLAVGGGTNPKIYPNAAVTAGATQMVLAVSGGSSPTLTGTLVAGDILTVKGKTYTITEGATAATNTITAKVYPALPALATTDEVTLTASHMANLAFNPNAFAFVTRSLVAPQGVQSYVTSYNGVSLRVVRGYDMKYKKEMLSMDVLYGYKTMYPELACRYLG